MTDADINRSYRRHLIGMTDALLSDIDKNRILARQGNVCFYCGDPLLRTIIWDHFIPRRANGPHHLNNRVAACGKCDGAKGGRLPTEEEIHKFLDQITDPDYVEQLQRC